MVPSNNIISRTKEGYAITAPVYSSLPQSSSADTIYADSIVDKLYTDGVLFLSAGLYDFNSDQKSVNSSLFWYGKKSRQLLDGTVCPEVYLSHKSGITNNDVTARLMDGARNASIRLHASEAPSGLPIVTVKLRHKVNLIREYMVPLRTEESLGSSIDISSANTPSFVIHKATVIPNYAEHNARGLLFKGFGAPTYDIENLSADLLIGEKSIVIKATRSIESRPPVVLHLRGSLDDWYLLPSGFTGYAIEGADRDAFELLSIDLIATSNGSADLLGVIDEVGVWSSSMILTCQLRPIIIQGVNSKDKLLDTNIEHQPNDQLPQSENQPSDQSSTENSATPNHKDNQSSNDEDKRTSDCRQMEKLSESLTAIDASFQLIMDKFDRLSRKLLYVLDQEDIIAMIQEKASYKAKFVGQHAIELVGTASILAREQTIKEGCDYVLYKNGEIYLALARNKGNIRRKRHFFDGVQDDVIEKEVHPSSVITSDMSLIGLISLDGGIIVSPVNAGPGLYYLVFRKGSELIYYGEDYLTPVTMKWYDGKFSSLRQLMHSLKLESILPAVEGKVTTLIPNSPEGTTISKTHIYYRVVNQNLLLSSHVMRLPFRSHTQVIRFIEDEHLKEEDVCITCYIKDSIDVYNHHLQ